MFLCTAVVGLLPHLSDFILILSMAMDEITDYRNIPISLFHSLHVRGPEAPCVYFHNT